MAGLFQVSKTIGFRRLWITGLLGAWMVTFAGNASAVNCQPYATPSTTSSDTVSPKCGGGDPPPPPNYPPIVSITSPANNASFTAPANVSVTASATDSDGVAKVDFFDGATLVGTDTVAPYSVALANLATGTHTFTARATDNKGASATSAAVSILVDAAPAVSITSPVNNASFTAPADVSLTASATDSDGTVAKVEFYDGATFLGQGTASGSNYFLTWSNASVGSHAITAKATDNSGSVTTSGTINLTVNPGIPNPPSGLGAAAGATNINLSWSDNDSYETGFKIERKIGTGGAYSQIATVAANVVSYSDTTVATGNVYYYRVRATNGTGDSAYSNEASINFSTPTAPSGLTATTNSVGGVSLAWVDASDNETGFKLERKTGSGGTYAQIVAPSANTTAYADSGLVVSTVYYYRIRATNILGDSAYSNEASSIAAPPNVTNGTLEYKYDPFGNLIQTNAGGVITTLTYDLRGRKIAMSDPDMGNWIYAYDTLDELVSQTDANGQTATMAYDTLGRIVSRTEADLASTWTYDRCPMGVGKLCQAATDNGYQRAHTYDNFGRPSALTTTIDTAYTVTTTYDSASRVATTTYPDGFATKNVYNSYGYLSEVRNNADNSLFWRAQVMSASGRITQEALGNALTTTRTYDVLDRLLTTVTTGTAGSVQDSTYAYDVIGNLAQRTDATQGVTEIFLYDNLNRLLQASGPALVTRGFDYDAIGNITYKSDVGIYTYGAKPHAVASVSGTVNASYNYDANGNLLSGAGRTLTYASFNLPLTIAKGTDSFQYTYNAEHERVRLVVTRTSGVYTTVYLHPNRPDQLLFEKETKPDVTESRHYVNAGAYLVGVHVTKSAGDPEMRYFHHDQIGSLTVVTNASGAVLERLAYEAFGDRRFPNGTADPDDLIIGVTTDRGFTEHEHLDEIGLIHMNGRVYDPLLGRFMTPDPSVPYPTSLQSFNRYSYARNNPLVSTDPSGFDDIGGSSFDFDFGSGFSQNTVSISVSTFDGGYCTAISPQTYMNYVMSGGITLSDNGISQSSSFMGAAIDLAHAIGSNWFEYSVGTINNAGTGANQQDIGQIILGAFRLMARGVGWAMDAVSDPMGLGLPPKYVNIASIDNPSQQVGAAGVELLSIFIAGPFRAEQRLTESLDEAFHYTFSKTVASIEREGLRAGSYVTPTGTLSPLQAQIDLALAPNRGLPEAVLRIDLAGLRQAGYEIPEITQVGRNFGMPGGGFEMQFPYRIPPDYITVIRP